MNSGPLLRRACHRSLHGFFYRGRLGISPVMISSLICISGGASGMMSVHCQPGGGPSWTSMVLPAMVWMMALAVVWSCCSGTWS